MGCVVRFGCAKEVTDEHLPEFSSASESLQQRGDLDTSPDILRITSPIIVQEEVALKATDLIEESIDEVQKEFGY